MSYLRKDLENNIPPENVAKDKREELQAILEDYLGSRNVYFQPPANVKMQYPCIVYEVGSGDTIFASNKPYHFTKRYTITVISKSPNHPVIDKIANGFMMVRYDRHFTADNLNHDSFSLYF